MLNHCTNALPTLLCALGAKKMNLYEVVWSPTLWGTGSEGSQVSTGGLGSPSERTKSNEGKRERVPLVEKGGKCLGF